MDQMPSNTPVMEPKLGPVGWLAVWIKVLTRPGEQTFVDITEYPDATLRTAFIWAFLAGVILGTVQAITQVVSSIVGHTSQMFFPGLEQFYSQSTGGPGAIVTQIVFSLCLIPFYGLFSIIVFTIGTAIFHWMAKLFGGIGTFEKLAYGIASITVPFTFTISIFSLLNVIPLVAICTLPILVILLIYIIILEVLAVKAVNRFGWGQAIGSTLLIPSLLFLCSCLIIIVLMLMGPVIGNVFSEINQSLVP